MPFVVLSLHISFFFFTFECGETTATTVIFDRHARHTHTHSVRTIFISPNDMVRDQMLALHTHSHRRPLNVDLIFILTTWWCWRYSHMQIHHIALCALCMGWTMLLRERGTEKEMFIALCANSNSFSFLFSSFISADVVDLIMSRRDRRY